MGVKNEEPKKPRKSWIYYYCIVLIVTVLLNTLLFPTIRERSIREVAYSEFLNMVDQGRVDMVELQEDQIHQCNMARHQEYRDRPPLFRP